MSQSALHLFIADAVMMLLAIGCALGIFHERRRRTVKRWRVLVPGLLAFAATVVLVVYPTARDLHQPQLWMVALLALLLGSARGAALSLFSDHNWGLVRVRRTYDGVVFALVLVLLATFVTGIEVRAGAKTHLAPALEFAMTVVSFFLLGRSIAGWIRAGMIAHDDLYEPPQH